MGIHVKPFGKTAGGEQVDIIRIDNKRGESVSFINYGAHLVSVRVLDRAGNLGEVCLGLDTVAQYEGAGNGHMGGTIGRYANRIAGASFTLGGQEYPLFANNGPNTLHGGQEGFDKKMWHYKAADDSVVMHRVSPHMEEGFPGELKVSVRFSFDDEAQLRIDYEAVSDRDTQVNLTNHAYFNLGYGTDVLEHLLQINADKVIEADDALIPTGRMTPVDGTPFDVRNPLQVGEALKMKDDAMFNAAKGYDIGYVVKGEGLRDIASLYAPDSGRRMRVLTDLPGVQCYSGQGFDCRRSDAVYYGPYAGLALETQYHPDTLHRPQFGDSLLKAGQVFKTTTIYAFSAR